MGPFPHNTMSVTALPHTRPLRACNGGVQGRSRP